MTRILIVDDDPAALRLTSGLVERAGFSVVTATGGEAALDMLRSDRQLAAVVLDLVMPERDGMAVMETMAREGLTTPVVVHISEPAPETIATALRAGAVDFVVRPAEPERLAVSLRNAIRLRACEDELRRAPAIRPGALRADDTLSLLATGRAASLLGKAARSGLPVLIEGEPGTGKVALAQALHAMSDRAARPLAIIECTRDRLHSLPRPAAGILVLREVGELDAAGQDRLFALLDSGGPRVVATSTRRLVNLARAGVFREDLYYRLAVLPIYLPPLRERPEDIAGLARRLLVRASALAGRAVTGLSEEALSLLGQYNWPGNLRQLDGALARAVALCEGDRLGPADFPQIVAAVSGRPAALKLTQNLQPPSDPVHVDAAIPPARATAAKEIPADRFLTASGEVAALSDLERDLIAFALSHHAGRMSRAARALRIGRSTLYRKLREYGLDDGVDSDVA